MQCCGSRYLLHSFAPSFIFRVILAITIIRALLHVILCLSASRVMPDIPAQNN